MKREKKKDIRRLSPGQALYPPNPPRTMTLSSLLYTPTRGELHENPCLLRRATVIVHQNNSPGRGYFVHSTESFHTIYTGFLEEDINSF